MMRKATNSAIFLRAAITLVAVLSAPAGFGENTFQQVVDVGGKYWLTNTANWSEGVLPTNSGVINAGTDGKLNYASGWTVVQNGSTVGIAGAGLTTTLDDCSWTVNGGQLGDVVVTLRNAAKVTVNAGGTLAAGSGRDLNLQDNAEVEVNGGTLSAGDQLWARAQSRIYGSGTFSVGDVEVIENAVMNLTNSTITVAADFGQRSTKESGGSVTLNGCTLTAGSFKVLSSGFELVFAGSNAGSATFTDWISGGADNGMTIDFQAGTGMSMTLGSGARALVFGGTTNSDAWAQALWENNRLLYDGGSTTNLGSLSWADATDSSVGFGDGAYFEFTPDGTYGGTLALISGEAPGDFTVTLNMPDSTVSFLTQSNYWYTVEFTASLTNGFNEVITNFPGDGLTNTIPVDTSYTNGFYRATESSSP